MPTLIYIHGRGLKPPAVEERKAWLDGLNRGLQRLSPPLHALADDDHFQLAYWSDVFYPPGATETNAGLSVPQLNAVTAVGPPTSHTNRDRFERCSRQHEIPKRVELFGEHPELAPVLGHCGVRKRDSANFGSPWYSK